ncbi:MAG: ATP-binding protein, partial [Panacagrimonas sp.]
MSAAAKTALSAASGKPPLPKWAEAVRRKYLGGEASMFLLHRNVFDRVLYDGKFWSVEEFLARVLLWDNKARILTYDPASRIRFVKGGSEKSEELLAAIGSEDPLSYLENQLHGTEPTAVILSYAGSIVPPGDEHFLAQADRVNVVRLHRWSLSESLAEKDSVVFLLSESLAEVHPKLVSNPRVAAVEIPLPDRDGRAAVIRHSDKGIDDKQLARLAGHTSGLRAVQIAQFL